MAHRTNALAGVALALFTASAVTGCAQRSKVTSLEQLAGKEFAVPTGTAADTLVKSRFADARFKYFNSVLDSCIAVKNGQADAAAYDEPILKNIAAKNPGLAVLPGMITTDQYGFAVALERKDLKEAIDAEVAALRANGGYDDMTARWLPASGSPKPMPELEPAPGPGVLRLGTASVTEPFSFVDGSRKVVGFDIELAARVAKRLGLRLEVVDMEFGAMIPALKAGKVDVIAACITITEERSKSVLFSAPYYTGGIAALVKQ